MPNKSPQIEAILDHFSRRAFGRERKGSMEQKLCVCCGGPAGEFPDALSAREYQISGFCFVCQESVFGAPEEE